jgi:hypothetical protein
MKKLNATAISLRKISSFIPQKLNFDNKFFQAICFFFKQNVAELGVFHISAISAILTVLSAISAIFRI